MSIKNQLIRAALRLLPIRKFHEGKPQRILVVATTALGDTLWATPALHSLRASFPKAYIGALTSPIGMEVFKHNPWIDKLYLFKKPLSMWNELYRERFDTALVFHASQRLPLPLCVAIGAGRIVGTAGLNKGLDALLTDSLPHHRQHEIVRRLKMVEAIGGKIVSETLSFFLQPEEREGLFFKKGNECWIGLHPGSKDRFKRWPLTHFGEVGRSLQKKLGCQIWITGTEEERELMEELSAQVPGSRVVPKGLRLRPFGALLEKLDLLIANDTGPVHLACALDRPVIGIYGATDPFLCGPHAAKKGVALSHPPTCRPCIKRNCRLPFCLLQIGPSEVIQVALDIIQNLKL